MDGIRSMHESSWRARRIQRSYNLLRDDGAFSNAADHQSSFAGRDQFHCMYKRIVDIGFHCRDRRCLFSYDVEARSLDFSFRHGWVQNYGFLKAQEARNWEFLTKSPPSGTLNFVTSPT